MNADEFFTTIKPGTRFQLVDPTGQSICPGPGDVLTAGGTQPDDECGVLHLFFYVDGAVGAFDPAEMRARGMQFEIVEVR